MTARPGRDGRRRYAVFRGWGPAALVLLLGAALAGPAQAGALRSARTGALTGRLPVVQTATVPRLARSALVASPAARPRVASRSTALADLLGSGLRSQAARVQATPVLGRLQAQGLDTLAGSPWWDYILWRRSLNPARFDFYHPGLAQLFRYEPSIPPTCQPICPPAPTPTVRPQTQQPPVPPQVPEPPASLVAITLLGAAWWARRWSRRHQPPEAAAIGGKSPAS